MENIGYLINQINSTARQLQKASSPAYKPNYGDMHYMSLDIARMAFDLMKQIEDEAKKHG